MELSGKIVVVTGASMGIGEAIAKIFVDHGASVVMLSRDAGRVEAARGRVGHGERTLAMACDVRHREDVDRAIGLTMHHFQRIDVWVNNAGHGLLDSVAQLDMSACREMFDTNFFGAVSVTRAVLPAMRRQRRSDPRSRPHTTSSIGRWRLRHRCRTSSRSPVDMSPRRHQEP